MLDIVAMILIVVEENLPFGVLWTPWSDLFYALMFWFVFLLVIYCLFFCFMCAGRGGRGLGAGVGLGWVRVGLGLDCARPNQTGPNQTSSVWAGLVGLVRRRRPCRRWRPRPHAGAAGAGIERPVPRLLGPAPLNANSRLAKPRVNPLPVGV
jgi:hypothetical protein